LNVVDLQVKLVGAFVIFPFACGGESGVCALSFIIVHLLNITLVFE